MNRNMEAVVWAMNARGLSMGAWKLLVMLARRVGRRGFDVWPSHKTMANDAEISVSSARRFLDELVEARYIVVLPRERLDGGRSSNIYRLQVRASMDFPGGATLEIHPDDADEEDTPPVQIEQRGAQIEQGPLFTVEHGNEHIPEGTYSNEDSPPSPCGEGHPPQEDDLFGDAPAKLPVVCEQPLEEFVEEQWKLLVEEEPGIAGVRTLDDSRKKKISARARAVAADAAGMRAAWDEIFRNIRVSPFLRGHAPPGKDRSSPFRLTLDFVLQPRQFLKILEGGYDDRHDRRTHDTESGRRFGPAERAGRASLERLRAAHAQRNVGVSG